MISRYLNGGIRFLEDLGKLTEPLDLYSRLSRAKKLKPEHRDINKYKTLNDFLDVTDLYRTDGPGYTMYDRVGKIIVKHWYLNGIQIHPEEWLEENGYQWPLDKQQQQELIREFG